jgi:hypothetical protein
MLVALVVGTPPLLLPPDDSGAPPVDEPPDASTPPPAPDESNAHASDEAASTSTSFRMLVEPTPKRAGIERDARRPACGCWIAGGGPARA